jgi:hypothetical protein
MKKTGPIGENAVARLHNPLALLAAGLVAALTLSGSHAADAPQQMAQLRERGGPPGPPPGAGNRGLELLGNARVNNRAPIILFRVDPRQSRVSEIRFRSGELPVLIETAEILYADGARQRVQILDRLAPGQQSRPIEVDRRRPIREVSVTKRPGLRPGETTLQLIGVVDAGPSGPPPGQWSGVGPKIPQGWVLFGVQEVSFRGDRDVIRVGEQQGRFERLALRISDNDIFLRELTVVYGNGERDRKVIETSIPAGSQTRPIDLRGDRFIREIELVYRSNPNSRNPAVVEVYGDIANTWIGDQGKHKGWLMLGAERVSMFSKERDAIRVDPRVGRIKAIRFAARKSDITFYSARIVYDNGEAENLPFSRKLKDGEYTSPIDLKGRGRRIDRIELKYRSKLGLKGEGIVEVWGLN